MKKQLLDNIISKKNNKEEFAIVTNISTGENFIFEKNKIIDKNFENYSDEINNYFNNKQNGIIENTDIFIDTYLRPIKVIIVGAVHITQYLLDYAKDLNFEIFIIELAFPMISCLIFFGSSNLGLSSVTITESAYLIEIAPIFFLFDRSLFPPQPNKTCKFPDVIFLASINTFSKASGV